MPRAPNAQRLGRKVLVNLALLVFAFIILETFAWAMKGHLPVFTAPFVNHFRALRIFPFGTGLSPRKMCRIRQKELHPDKAPSLGSEGVAEFRRVIMACSILRSPKRTIIWIGEEVWKVTEPCVLLLWLLWQVVILASALEQAHSNVTSPPSSNAREHARALRNPRKKPIGPQVDQESLENDPHRRYLLRQRKITSAVAISDKGRKKNKIRSRSTISRSALETSVEHGPHHNTGGESSTQKTQQQSREHRHITQADNSRDSSQTHHRRDGFGYADHECHHASSHLDLSTTSTRALSAPPNLPSSAPAYWSPGAVEDWFTDRNLSASAPRVPNRALSAPL